MSSSAGPSGARSHYPDEARSDTAAPPSDLAAPQAPNQGAQKTRRTLAYCSATDRNVPVLVRIGPRMRKRGRASYKDAERVVCLDYGVRCTGFLCPLFDVPTLTEEELPEPPHRRPS